MAREIAMKYLALGFMSPETLVCYRFHGPWKLHALNIISVMKQYLQFLSLLESLSKDVFERRMSIGSEVFSIFICLDADKFVLPSFFSLIKTIYPRVSTKPLPNDAKSPLLVDFRRSKTLLLKLPIILDKKYHYCSLNQRNGFSIIQTFPAPWCCSGLSISQGHPARI